MILKTLRAHPIWAALLTLALYVGFFLYADLVHLRPLFGRLRDNAAGVPAPAVVQGAVVELPFQIGIALVLVLIVTALGWRRAVGFRPSLPGGLKFVLIPVALILVFYAINLGTDISRGGPRRLPVGNPGHRAGSCAE